jgi:hypothetical protein
MIYSLIHKQFWYKNVYGMGKKKTCKVLETLQVGRQISFIPIRGNGCWMLAVGYWMLANS